MRALIVILLATAAIAAGQQEKIVRVDLAYHGPGSGFLPNFSPYGTQVKLTDLPPGVSLPEGAALPAKTGTMQVGPDQNSWIRILVTAAPDHPQDLCRLFIDRNRNGDFRDDGPVLTASPNQNPKTKAWSASFRAELSIPYGNGIVEPYSVSFWSVREGETAPDLIRYSWTSCRSGTAT